MNKRKEVLAIVIVSIFLGIILSIQFKTVNKTFEGALPTQKAQQLTVDLKKAEKERDALIKKIEELEEKTSQYEKGEVQKDVYVENLYNDAMKYRLLAGYLDVEGPGVVLEIDNPVVDLQYGDQQYFNNIAAELELILQAISVLNAADAEAISINGQRYTAFTEIERAANHIEINGVSTNAPITIKAIGDPKTLESALSIKTGIIDNLRDWGYIAQVKQESKIEIPKYKRSVEFIHASPIEENKN